VMEFDHIQVEALILKARMTQWFQQFTASRVFVGLLLQQIIPALKSPNSHSTTSSN
jgi:hypothetical protein